MLCGAGGGGEDQGWHGKVRNIIDMRAGMLVYPSRTLYEECSALSHPWGNVRANASSGFEVKLAETRNTGGFESYRSCVFSCVYLRSLCKRMLLYVANSPRRTVEELG